MASTPIERSGKPVSLIRKDTTGIAFHIVKKTPPQTRLHRRLHRRRWRTLPSLVVAWVVICSLTAGPASADELLLRDWTRLADVDVTEFDAEGIRLADGRRFGWGQVESGQVDEAQQVEFDRFLSELGEPLFRLRQRLRLRDDQQILDLAESLWPQFKNRTGESAALVSAGLIRGQIATGQREAAVLPLVVLEHQMMSTDGTDTLNEKQINHAYVEYGLAIDANTGLCANLLPIWQDQAKAQSTLTEALTWLEDAPSPLPPGVHVYLASLAAFANDAGQAQQQLDMIPLNHDSLLELRSVMQWQLSLQQDPGMSTRSIEPNLDKLLPRNQAITLYWLGVAGLKANNPARQQNALLQLLRIPAEFPDEADAAAAALQQVVAFFRAQSADPTAAEKLTTVRSELLKAYPNSWFAEQERRK